MRSETVWRTTASLSYDERARQALDGIRAGLSANMDLIVDLPPDSAQQAIRCLLSLACEAQNVRNITLGREYLAKMPRMYLLEHIESCASFLLETTGEWEYRRLMELYSILGDRLVKGLVDYGKRSTNEEIQAAALEWAEGLQHHGSV